jgi:hypothetical protein
MAIIYKKNCERCKRYYEGRGKNFCSNHCSLSGRKRTKESIKKMLKNQNYKNRVIVKLKLGPKIICRCGNIFYSSPSNHRKYCSRECFYKYVKRNPWLKGLTKDTDKRVLDLSIKKQEFWKKVKENPELFENIMKKVLSISRPTSYEKKLLKLIDENKLAYIFTGDGQVWIGNSNPDFINCNGGKKVIEVFESFFKIKRFGSVEKYKRQKVENYGKFGFKVMFIDEKDLKDEQVCINKIKEF